jgi:hypothetical protein
MKEFLRNAFTADSLIGLFICALIVGLLYIGARLLDEELGEPLSREGKVTGREYSPAVTYYTKVGEIMTPTTIPDSYSLTVETDEGLANVPCSLYEYMNTVEGTRLRFNDKIGYFTGIRYKK